MIEFFFLATIRQWGSPLGVMEEYSRVKVLSGTIEKNGERKIIYCYEKWSTKDFHYKPASKPLNQFQVKGIY